MACMSACEELKRGRIQTGDGCGEPSAPNKVIVATTPASQDVACEARSALSERPSRVRLRVRNLAWKCCAWDSTRPRGQLKWWRVLVEFGKQGSTCERVCEAPRAACRVFCSRSGFLGRCARAGLHRKPRRFGVRVTSSVGTSQGELRVSCTRWLAWGTPRK